MPGSSGISVSTSVNNTTKRGGLEKQNRKDWRKKKDKKSGFHPDKNK